MTAPTTSLGNVLRDELGMRLEFERHYPDPLEDVWSAVTDSDRMSRWIGTWSGDPDTGTVSFLMSSEEGATAEPVTIDACERPTRLAVTMETPDGPWPLEIVLTRVGDATNLRFTHRLAEPYDATSVGPGWHYYLDRMEAVLHGDSVSDTWDDYYPALKDAYALPS